MANSKPRRRTLRSLLSETIREEWRIWLAIAILLVLAVLLANPLAALLEKSAFIKVLDSLSKLGLLVAIVAFLREIPKWEQRSEEEAQRRQFEYWKTIDAANAAKEASSDGRFTSHALRIALESLAKERDLMGKPIAMRNIDLSGVNLEDNLKLAQVDLILAKFRYANLSGADFSKSILHRANFSRARLFSVNFDGADFGVGRKKAIFKQALYNPETRFPTGFVPETEEAYKIAPKSSLKGASLQKALLWDADLEEANLEEADLERASLDGATLYKANLQNANLQGIKARNTIFREANLSGADLRGANLFSADFENADINNANFQNTEFITLEQIKAANNWEQAIYDDGFRKELGLVL